MIKREKLEALYIKRILRLEENIHIINKIPINIPVLIEHTSYVKPLCKTVCLVKYFNPESLRIEPIAMRDTHYGREARIKTEDILNWELFNKRDLPLLISWDHSPHFPLLDDMIKNYKE